LPLLFVPAHLANEQRVLCPFADLPVCSSVS
jgi:hypothetical protein